MAAWHRYEVEQVDTPYGYDEGEDYGDGGMVEDGSYAFDEYYDAREKYQMAAGDGELEEFEIEQEFDNAEDSEQEMVSGFADQYSNYGWGNGPEYSVGNLKGENSAPARVFQIVVKLG